MLVLSLFSVLFFYGSRGQRVSYIIVRNYIYSAVIISTLEYNIMVHCSASVIVVCAGVNSISVVRQSFINTKD